jgi:DNA-directed RNA polymerase alpha subunit
MPIGQIQGGPAPDEQRASACHSPRGGEFEFDLLEAEARDLEATLLAAAQTIAFNPIFLRKVNELELSVRSANSLAREGVKCLAI